MRAQHSSSNGDGDDDGALPQRTRGAGRIAHVQRALTLALAVCALGWLTYWQVRFPALAWAGFLAVALAHTWFLAIEFVATAPINRGDPAAPHAPARALFGAWLSECCMTPRVFYWRQPFRSRAVPDFLPPQAAGRRGVVLVHGFVCNRGFWNPWLELLRAQNRAFVAPNFEPVTGSIDRYCAMLDEAVRRVTAATGRPPLLVCHSMGGLIARAWLRSTGGDEAAAERVAHIVTIATPHHGTWLGRFSVHTNGRQMRLGSDWLAELRRAEPQARDALFTCWWSDCDNIVAPAPSATLPGADNRLVRGAPHVALAFRREVIEGTLALLNEDANARAD